MTATTPKKVLRPYQLDQLNFLLESDENTLIQSPTGTGKSVVIEAYINALLALGKKSIFVITPSKELCLNLKSYFGSMATVAFSGETPNIFAPIFISTFQSASKYIELYQPDHIISDEAHISVCATWSKLLKKVNVRHDGFTATPNRLDGKPLRENFSKIYVSEPIQWFIDNKYLAPLDLTICDFPEFMSAKGDSLGSQEEIFGSIPEVERSIKIFTENSLNDDKVLFFVTGINHGLLLEDELKKIGVDASFISSKTKTKERDRVFQSFQNGDKKVLINVGLFTTGVDIPKCSSVYLCRFTFSPTTFFQMVGRGWRYLDGKTYKLFDLSGNCWHHGSPAMFYEWSLDSNKKAAKTSNKYSKYFRCECGNELILRSLVTEPIMIICNSCSKAKYLAPKPDTSTDVVEKGFSLLDVDKEYVETVVFVFWYFKRHRLNIYQKIQYVTSMDLPTTVKRKFLKHLGLNEKALNQLS